MTWINGKYTFMHRYILGAPSDKQVDHINGSGIDNRRDNIRLCTKAQNAHNSRTPKDNKSGYKGVFWDERISKWVSQIGFGGELIRIGYFTDIIKAAQAYDDKARELFGEFARPNLPA